MLDVMWKSAKDVKTQLTRVRNTGRGDNPKMHKWKDAVGKSKSCDESQSNRMTLGEHWYPSLKSRRVIELEISKAGRQNIPEI